MTNLQLEDEPLDDYIARLTIQTVVNQQTTFGVTTGLLLVAAKIDKLIEVQSR